MSTKNLKRSKVLFLQLGAVTKNDLTYNRLDCGIIVHPGRLLLMQTTATTLIKSHTTCLLKMWKIRDTKSQPIA